MKNLKIRISKIDSMILRFFFVLFGIIAANLVVLYVFILFYFIFTEFSVFLSLFSSFFFIKWNRNSKYSSVESNAIHFLLLMTCSKLF